MKRMGKRTLLAVLALLAAGPRSMVSAPKKSAPAELNLTDLDGRKVHLKDYRGKTVVLNFWATWCVPCKEEMPLLVTLEKQWAPRGVVFIGASLDDRASQKNIPAFLKTFAIGFPVWKGATGDDLAKLGMGEAVPDTAFIDENGDILMRVLGEIKKSQLDERLEWITGDRKGPSPQALLRNL
jgi:thiol-disulfide isomerase/thioredoxin